MKHALLWVSDVNNMMLVRAVEILPFESKHQAAVEQLVLPIQQGEFGVQITRDEQPDLVDIAGTFQTGIGNFWVALNGGTTGDTDRVVGTIGVVDIGNEQVALKKMFVHKDFRGKQHGVAARLMEVAKRWCEQHGVQTILLGTTGGMHAAHRFYEKNGFVEVAPQDLPPNFPLVHVDSKFYRCDLA